MASIWDRGLPSDPPLRATCRQCGDPLTDEEVIEALYCAERLCENCQCAAEREMDRRRDEGL